MYPSALYLVMILFHGTICHTLDLAQGQLTGVTGRKEYLRQTSSQIECVNDELDAALAGENSQFVSDCKTTAADVASLSFSSPQSLVDSVGLGLCMPECGSAILNAISSCDIFDEPGSEAKYTNLYVDICGTKQQTRCYEIFANGASYISPIGGCYETYESSGVCRPGCPSLLTDAVEDQGCCLNLFYDFFSNFDLRGLHESCSVNIPGPCNNSPLTVVEVTLEVTLESYSNPDHEECGGEHCEGIFGGECDNVFTFCLRSIGSPSCLETLTTNDITADEFTFGDSELETLGINNPLEFSVITSSQLELVVSVADDDTIPPDDKVDEFIIPLNSQINIPTTYTGACGRDTRIVLSIELEAVDRSEPDDEDIEGTKPIETGTRTGGGSEENTRTGGGNEEGTTTSSGTQTIGTSPSFVASFILASSILAAALFV